MSSRTSSAAGLTDLIGEEGTIVALTATEILTGAVGVTDSPLVSFHKARQPKADGPFLFKIF
jgi:hypothetical protein